MEIFMDMGMLLMGHTHPPVHQFQQLMVRWLVHSIIQLRPCTNQGDLQSSANPEKTVVNADPANTAANSVPNGTTQSNSGTVPLHQATKIRH
jgi:hypothetical protein